MTKLKFIPADAVTEIASPANNTSITLKDSALMVFTDFLKTSPLILDDATSAIEAERLMRKTHVRFKIVVDQYNHFLGVISSDDLSEQAQLSKANKVTARAELSVTDLMTPKAELEAICRAQLDTATIGDVVDVLKDHGHQHCLVVDTNTGQICGLFSASDISRILHLPIDIQHRSSFYEIAKLTTLS